MKTHCPKGHPYEGDNLWVYRQRDKSGNVHLVRSCRTCMRVRSRKNAEDYRRAREDALADMGVSDLTPLLNPTASP